MKLKFNSVSFTFLGRNIVENINLTLRQGETVAIVGRSGSGKTTILQLAAGLYTAASGSIQRNYRRQAIVFQEPRLLPWKTTYQNIAYAITDKLTEKDKSDIVKAQSRAVGLNLHDLHKYPAALSGGMRQRASVARALAIKPDIIFLDEPFAAVDVGMRRSLQDIIIRQSKALNYCALFVTHDLHEAVRIAHRIILIGGDPSSIITERLISGNPGERSEREIFDYVEAFADDPLFAQLLSGQEIE